jgi:predicted anti-sigma-YlaC factor YlaD
VTTFRYHRPICERARAWASLELDDELSELERALLAAHLRECVPCAAAVEEIRTFTMALRAAPPERLQRPLVVRRRRPRVGYVAVRVAAAATLATFAAGLGMLAGSLGNDGTPPAPRSSSELALLPSNDEFRQLRRPPQRDIGSPSETPVRPARLRGV